MSAETAPALLEAAPTARALAPAESSGDRPSASAATASLYERYHVPASGSTFAALEKRHGLNATVRSVADVSWACILSTS